MLASSSKKRTVVYIDGFNFYYGVKSLKLKEWRWLNVQSFFTNLLGIEHDVVKIKLFTAKVKPTDQDFAVRNRQSIYFQALLASCPLLEIYYGHFLRNPVSMMSVKPPPKNVEVWKTEEKGTDVNLALHMLNDAWLNFYDCAVVVSNDSDLAMALQLVKEQNKKTVGLIAPGAGRKGRPLSKKLKQYASFIKPLRASLFKQHQLPDVIPNSTICKPNSWYINPEHVN